MRQSGHLKCWNYHRYLLKHFNRMSYMWCQNNVICNIHRFQDSLQLINHIPFFYMMIILDHRWLLRTCTGASLAARPFTRSEKFVPGRESLTPSAASPARYSTLASDADEYLAEILPERGNLTLKRIIGADHNINRDHTERLLPVILQWLAALQDAGYVRRDHYVATSRWLH